MKLLLPFLVAVPLLAQLPPGVTRIRYPDGMGPTREPQYLAAAPNGVLWGANGPYPSTQGVLDGIDLATGATTTNLPLPAGGSAIGGLAVAEDGSVWIAASSYVGRYDPETHTLHRFPGSFGAAAMAAGPDGNIWIAFAGGTVVRFRPDGTILSSWSDTPSSARIYGAAFGTDGALYVSAEGRLVRVTMTGERTVFPAATAGQLYAGPGFFWVGAKFDNNFGPQQPVPAEVVKLSYTGTIAGTYRVNMVPRGADALGNLWLRGTEGENELYAQLTPTGVLMRWVPVPGLPWDTFCNTRRYGGFAVLPDGRLAFADYYLNFAASPGTCRWDTPGRDTSITILDPRVLPVQSVEQLNPVRRRPSRH